MQMKFKPTIRCVAACIHNQSFKHRKGNTQWYAMIVLCSRQVKGLLSTKYQLQQLR